MFTTGTLYFLHPLDLEAKFRVVTYETETKKDGFKERCTPKIVSFHPYHLAVPLFKPACESRSFSCGQKENGIQEFLI
jgi:hypothetical protein